MNLNGWLRFRRKRDTIKRYIIQLGPLLSHRYGKAEHYSPVQVREVIQVSGLPSGETTYALVLYCSPEMFAADQAASAGAAEYWQLRTEIMEYDFRHGRAGGQGGGAWEGSMADYAAWFCSDSTDGLP